MLIIDYDIYLNNKFIEPTNYDIFCQSLNIDAPHDLRYLGDIKIKYDNVKSINAGIMKFNTLEILKEYYLLINNDLLNVDNIMYYEQILPAILMNIKWKGYATAYKIPYWYSHQVIMDCNLDFTNLNNHYCNFMGNNKHDRVLLLLLENNLKKINKG